jgi:hypothetical protein
MNGVARTSKLNSRMWLSGWNGRVNSAVPVTRAGLSACAD